MAYLIDSDWMIDGLDELPNAVNLINGLAPQGVSISIITYLELYQGVVRSPDPPAAEARLEKFIEPTPVLPLSPAGGGRCALVRHPLKGAGKRGDSRAPDLIVAAAAIEDGTTLVSRNGAGYVCVASLGLYRASS